eukprot:4315996-Amphidinium_carterae.2
MSYPVGVELGGFQLDQLVGKAGEGDIKGKAHAHGCDCCEIRPVRGRTRPRPVCEDILPERHASQPVAYDGATCRGPSCDGGCSDHARNSMPIKDVRTPEFSLRGVFARQIRRDEGDPMTHAHAQTEDLRWYEFSSRGSVPSKSELILEAANV